MRTGSTGGIYICETVAILSVESDMSKALDPMHPILVLSKLKAYKYYFNGRENKTRVGMAKSSWRDIKRGYPQGTFLRVRIIESWRGLKKGI